MSQSESNNLLNELLEQDAFYVQAWLKDIWSGQLKAPEGFNWLGLAQAATSIAHSGISDDATAPDISWAEVATSIYDKLATGASPDGQKAYMLSSMMLRAAMIAKLGSISGHSVLDLDLIINWFFDNLAMSRQEVEIKVDSWIKLPIDDIRELRKIKNQLNVISVLAESGQLTSNQELTEWLSLRQKLP